jgi:hypothetical protein
MLEKAFRHSHPEYGNPNTLGMMLALLPLQPARQASLLDRFLFPPYAVLDIP